MNKDIGNLSLRSEQQKEKLESVPQKAVYMELAKQLRMESTQQKKLQEQVISTTTYNNRICIIYLFLASRNSKYSRQIDRYKVELRKRLTNAQNGAQELFQPNISHKG